MDTRLLVRYTQLVQAISVEEWETDELDPKDVCEHFSNNIYNTLTEIQVIFKLIASPINPSDLNVLQGTYGIKPQLPVILGFEAVSSVLCDPLLTPTPTSTSGRRNSGSWRGKRV